MGIIRVLDDHIANQIAAGEVVERPASVVKELVENSVDAGSTRVEIKIEEGGLTLIRVTDNGSGMAVEDCETAFFRHATSKISDSRDLFQIRTLGFRGEALPSISAVARVEITTSNTGDGLGRRLTVEGGEVKDSVEIAAPQGTDICVRDLFYNTPARLKYMKTLQTELGHVSDYIYRLALANPQIAFTLQHNDHILLKTQGNGDLLQVIAAVYGTSTAKAMISIEAENLDYSIQGFISRLELTRANRTAISVIVNGRYIRNYAITAALIKAYHTLLPIHRFPIAVLQISMDPSLIDVNVHPSKLEVRFSKELELQQWIEEESRRVLGRQVLIPTAPVKTERPAKVLEQLQWYAADPVPGIADPVSGTAAPVSRSDSDVSAHPTAELREALKPEPEPRSESESSSKVSIDKEVRGETMETLPGLPGGSASIGDIGSNQYTEDRTASKSAAPRASRAVTPASRSHSPAANGASVAKWLQSAAEQREDSSVGLPRFPELTPIGQAHGTYIMAQNEEALYLIDQHAAHERIHYEYYYEKFGQMEQASQQLLVPITLEFTPNEAMQLTSQFHLLEQAGVFLEHFGGHTFLVRSHPHWLPQGEEKDIIEEMIDWILTEKKAIDIAKLREKSAILCSCKASIKANQSMTIPEMESLLQQLGRCRVPYTCPHGRPIVISFSTYELEKMFKRVM